MMTKELERKLAEATELAKQAKHEYVTLEHVFLSLTSSPKLVEVLEALSVNVQVYRSHLRAELKKQSLISEEQLEMYGGFEAWVPEFTMGCHRLFQRAALQVHSSGRNQINESSLLVALFYEQDSQALYGLQAQKLTQFDVINYLSHGMEKSEATSFASSEGNNIDGGPADANGKSKKESALESFCQNLNERAKNGAMDPLVGRKDIIERMILTLARRSKNNPLLIGEPGVGKTAIVEGLAQKIISGEVPHFLKDKLIYSLDLGSLLAGTRYRGDFEGRLKSIIKECIEKKNIILFVDEIHTLVGAGSTQGGSMDASNLLKPALSRGEISCIGSTTHQEFRQYFEKDRALSRRFQKLDLNEPSAEEATEILKGLKAKFENHHQVKINDAALQACVELSQKYIHNKLLPDKAIDLLDEACAKISIEETAPESRLITEKSVEQALAKITQLPVTSISSNERELLRDLDKKLKSFIFGQDEAIDRLVQAIKLNRSGLNPHTKPIGSFLFTGPTGVGKTEVAKQLAFHLGVKFQRFDMSEYMEKHSVARLIGAPPGYVGFEEGGQLTEAVTKNPYSVILLDEIEKAHPDITQALLQVMDAGRLTDSQGRTADFRNVVLILTSNAGAQETARGSIGFVKDSRSSVSLEAIKKFFAPEFLNRLDAVVSFKDLDENLILRVTRKFTEELQTTLLAKNIVLTVREEVYQWLVKKAWTPAYGARPLARAVDEHLKKPLVDEVLFGRLSQGGQATVEVEKDVLRFTYGTSDKSLDKNIDNSKSSLRNKQTEEA